MEENLIFEQIEFGSDDFAVNPEPRCPCLLLLDTSGSMSGRPIAQLNEGIKNFRNELINDPIAQKRVEIAVVTFGPVTVKSDFHTVSNFQVEELRTTGDTPMGSAITTGLNLLSKRKQEYKMHGISYYRPWIILITDGAPTDNWHNAAKMIREGEEKKSFAFFAVGVEESAMSTLKQISVREPLKLKGLMFRELFMWLSGSMKSVSTSVMGSAVKLLPPSGWSEV